MSHIIAPVANELESADVFFREAIHHVRWKNTLRPHLEKIFNNLNTFSSCKTFEEVFKLIEKVFKPVYGIGKLATYDTTAAICRRFDIPIEKVYIIGSGPQKAINYLNIQRFYDRQLNVYYCKRSDVLAAFGDPSMSNDDMESNLCLFGTGRGGGG